ncbi:MAG: SMI1/KNR4 family protein [Bacteroidia bacterium]
MPFPLDIKYIIETELELDIVFPDNFKSKMIKENGGDLTTEDDDWQLIPFFDKSDNKRISRTCNHIGLESKQARDLNNFPENGVAIASNGCGDILILLPTNENSKKLSDEIFFWFHETGEFEKVAEKIDELIGK